MQEPIATTVASLYVVRVGEDSYFAGYDANQGKSVFVSTPQAAKKFTNKYDIKLRPDETLVEIKVDLAKVEVELSEPFRPHRRKIAGK